MTRFSEAMTEEILKQEMTDVYITLLTITHDDLEESLYISSDPTVTLPVAQVYGTVSNGQEYVFLPFQLSLQEQTDNLLARAKISFDNIDRSIMRAIRTISNSPPVINIKIIMASDPDTVEAEIPNLRLNNIRADAFTVEAELLPFVMQNEQYPYKTFSQSGFPGVFGTR